MLILNIAETGVATVWFNDATVSSRSNTFATFTATNSYCIMIGERLVHCIFHDTVSLV